MTYTAPIVTAQAVHTITATSGSNSVSLDICIAISNTVYNAHTTYGAVGDGSTDDTVAITSALAATGNGICRLPYTGNPYMINASHNSGAGLRLNQGNTLLLDPGVILQTITNSSDPSDQSTYRTIVMSNVGICNMAIVGGTIYGDRKTTRNPGGRNIPNFNSGSGPYFEAGDGIGIYNGANHVVLGVSVHDCCCDGMNVQQGSVNPSNVVIQGCLSDNNRRQGLSICAGDNIIVKTTTFSNTNGNDPGAGVDLEPSSSTEAVTNVQFLNCSFLNNQGGGLMGGSYNATVDHITIDHCYFSGNGGSDYGAGGIFADDLASSWTVTNNTVVGSVAGNTDYQGGIHFRECSNMTVIGNILNGNVGWGINMTDCANANTATSPGVSSHCSGNSGSNNTLGLLTNDSTVIVS